MDIEDKTEIYKLMDMDLQITGEGEATGVIVVDDRLHSRAGHIHGGMIATIIDTVMGWAVASAIEADERPATVDLHVRYIRPMVDGTLTTKASVVHKGRTFTQVSAEAHRDDGKILATADASFVVRKIAEYRPGRR